MNTPIYQPRLGHLGMLHRPSRDPIEAEVVHVWSAAIVNLSTVAGLTHDNVKVVPDQESCTQYEGTFWVPYPSDKQPSVLATSIRLAEQAAPRVTAADVEASIASEHYFTAEDGAQGAFRKDNKDFEGIPTPSSLALMTFCVLVLSNGFTVTGHSACANPAIFDAETGRREARKRALDQVWMVLGYDLKQRLFEMSQDARVSTNQKGI